MNSKLERRCKDELHVDHVLKELNSPAKESPQGREKNHQDGILILITVFMITWLHSAFRTFFYD